MNREKINLAVIKALVKGEGNKELLKGYTGWGGLRDAMYNPSTYHALKEGLTTAEIDLIKKTMGNAYYTPAFLVKAMYDYLQMKGFKGGAILEPAAGTGVFIEHMPEEIKRNSKIFAVELEPISARILKGLYPDVHLKNCGFETLNIQTQFDLVIGNPPYGKNKLMDTYHPDLKDLAIHHYFVAKSMRLLKQGGVLAMVLPSFFLDNVKDHARGIIAAEGGDLMDAFRLPDHLFDSAKVTVDLVFLQKGGKSRGIDWVNTDRIKVKEESFRLNHYFQINRKNILGELTWVNAYGRKLLTCTNQDDNIEDKLSQAIQGIVPLKSELNFQTALNQIEGKISLLESVKKKMIILQEEYQNLMQCLA